MCEQKPYGIFVGAKAIRYSVNKACWYCVLFVHSDLMNHKLSLACASLIFLAISSFAFGFRASLKLGFFSLSLSFRSFLRASLCNDLKSKWPFAITLVFAQVSNWRVFDHLRCWRISMWTVFLRSQAAKLIAQIIRYFLLLITKIFALVSCSYPLLHIQAR